MTPVTDYDLPTDIAAQAGDELLSRGKIGCLILAGGQGSRLGAIHPKALTSITPIRKKTLLQIFCEKGAAAAKVYGSSLPMAVMTSSENHEMIEAYLKQNNNFGVSNLSLFQQRNTPFLTEEGIAKLLSPEKSMILRQFASGSDAATVHLTRPTPRGLVEESGRKLPQKGDFSGEMSFAILSEDRQGHFGEGPNGNGEALHLLSEYGIVEKWKKEGIEYVMVLPIDNPLANPFDATLCGIHRLQKNEATIKAILRTDQSEKVGVVVKKEGKITVQEYSELPVNFEAPIAHIGLFCFSLSWIEKIQGCELPWHFAHKKHHQQMVWKPEKFLFDVLPFADKVGIVVYPRDETYAPLKNATGDKSLATVQEALHNFDRKLLKRLTDKPLPDYFELDPSIYYLRDRPQKISNYILEMS